MGPLPPARLGDRHVLVSPCRRPSTKKAIRGGLSPGGVRPRVRVHYVRRSWERSVADIVLELGTCCSRNLRWNPAEAWPAAASGFDQVHLRRSLRPASPPGFSMHRRWSGSTEFCTELSFVGSDSPVPSPTPAPLRPAALHPVAALRHGPISVKDLSTSSRRTVAARRSAVTDRVVFEKSRPARFAELPALHRFPLDVSPVDDEWKRRSGLIARLCMTFCSARSAGEGRP